MNGSKKKKKYINRWVDKKNAAGFLLAHSISDKQKNKQLQNLTASFQ